MQLIEGLIVNENNIAYHQMIGNSYQLNNISNEIIISLQENKTKEEIIEELSDQYGVSKHELFIDVGDFLAKLKIYGLIQ